MMGDLNLPAIREWRRGHGLGIILQPIKERFTLGNSSESKVIRQIVIPIGIEGYSGELKKVHQTFRF